MFAQCLRYDDKIGHKGAETCEKHDPCGVRGVVSVVKKEEAEGDAANAFRDKGYGMVGAMFFGCENALQNPIHHAGERTPRYDDEGKRGLEMKESGDNGAGTRYYDCFHNGDWQ